MKNTTNELLNKLHSMYEESNLYPEFKGMSDEEFEEFERDAFEIDGTCDTLDEYLQLIINEFGKF